MDERVGAATKASLTIPTPPEDVSGGILTAGGGFIGNAGVTLLGAAAGALLSMCNEVLTARFLGVAAYGLYALALIFARSSALIAVFGTPESVMYYLPVHLSRGERRHALGTIVGCVPVPLALSFAFALTAWQCGEWIASHVLGQPQAGRFLVVIAFAIPLFALSDIVGHTARAFGRALPHVLISNVIPQLCVMAVLLTLLLSGGPEIGVAYGLLAGLAAGVILGVVFVLRLIRVRIGSARPLLQLPRLYGYAVFLAINSWIALVLAYTDLFLLGIFTDASTVGAYRGCMQIVLVFDLLWTGLGAATAPLYTVLIAERRWAALQDAYTAAIRVTTLLALPLLLVILVNGSDFLAIMGPAFAVGAPALLALAYGQCAKAALGAAAVVLIMGGRQRLEAGNMVLTAGANLALNLILVPAFGLLGAAFATATSLIGLAVLRCLQLRRVLALRTFDPVLLRALALTLPLTLAIWAASVLLGVGPGSGLVSLTLRLAVMGVVLGVSLWLFCLNAQDRAMLLRVALRRPPAAVRSDGQR